MNRPIASTRILTLLLLGLALAVGQNGDVQSMFLPAVSEMGLKLTQTKGPVETFVIDHAERPTPN